jgi:hypothetical protein
MLNVFFVEEFPRLHPGAPDVWGAKMEGKNTFLNLNVRDCHSLVLAKLLKPGLDAATGDVAEKQGTLVYVPRDIHNMILPSTQPWA